LAWAIHAGQTKELQMTQTTEQPRLTERGIVFTVRVDSVNRECEISKESLTKLSALRSGSEEPMETFRAFEATINGVARRMVAANVQGTPLQLKPESFH
jgi:hypothetical protein